jgi:hypothetical protein
MGISSLVLGGLNIALVIVIPILVLPLSFLGVVLGIIGICHDKGKGFGVAGMLTNLLILVVAVSIIILVGIGLLAFVRRHY